MATKQPSGEVVIALSNFDPKGRNQETVPITLFNMPAGQNNVTINYLNKAPVKVTASPTEDGRGIMVYVPMRPYDVAVVKFQ